MEELQQDKINEATLNFEITGSREDTLQIIVSLGLNCELKVTAFVDCGATFCLINNKIFNQLDCSVFPLIPSKYKYVKGIGGITFPVLGEVVISLQITPFYKIKNATLVIVPEAVTDYPVLIGYDILKRESLLPDAARGELVMRRGDKLIPLVKDISESSTEVISGRTKTKYVIPPHTFQRITLVTTPLNNRNLSFFFIPNNNTSGILDASLINVKDFEFEIIIYNPNSHYLKLKE